MQPLADELGCALTDELEALGLIHSLDPAVLFAVWSLARHTEFETPPRRLKKFTVDKFHTRMRFAAGATRAPSLLLLHLRSLGFLYMFKWVGGFAQPSPEEL